MCICTDSFFIPLRKLYHLPPVFSHRHIIVCIIVVLISPQVMISDCYIRSTSPDSSPNTPRLCSSPNSEISTSCRRCGKGFTNVTVTKSMYENLKKDCVAAMVHVITFYSKHVRKTNNFVALPNKHSLKLSAWWLSCSEKT